MDETISVKKTLGQYTREEFLAMENFKPKGYFRDVIIVPTDEMHDSGYRCMKFILANKGRIVGVVSGWSDVVHINGIGGYGRFVEDSIKTQTVKRVAWSIDCLPESGCIRLFSDTDCVAEDFIGSDFIFYYA